MTLDTILPDSGYYCIFAVSGKGKPTTHFYGTKRAMVLGARKLEKAGHEVWMAIATYATKNGGRKQNNAFKVRSFVLDIDGFDKDLLTTKDAIAGIRKITKLLGLGDPAIIMSGGGMHLYWAFDADVIANEWMDVAKSFKQCVAEHTPLLAVDQTRTADSAGLLRLPGSMNKKRGKRVRILQKPGKPADFATVAKLLRKLYPQEHDSFLRLGSPTVHIPGGGPNLVGGVNKIHNDEPADALRIAKECGQLRAAVRTGGLGHQEPQWAAFLGLAAFTDKAKSMAIAVSSGDPRYSKGATLKKLDHAIDKMTGPTRCKTLHSHDPDICERCPHWTKISTPLQLGRDTYRSKVPAAPLFSGDGGEDAPSAPPSLPDSVWIPQQSDQKYKLSSDGKMAMTKEKVGKKWDWVQMATVAMNKCAIDKDTGKIHGVYFRNYDPKRGTYDEERLVLLSKSHQPAAAFTDAGLQPDSADEKNAHKYAKDVFNTAHNMTNQITLHSGDGHTTDKTIVFNGLEYRANKPPRPCEYIDRDRKRIEPRGTLDQWKEYVNPITLPHNAMYTAVWATALAAPLFHFINLRGFTTAMTSTQSGLGKSVTLEAMNSIYYPTDDSPLLLANTSPVNLVRAMSNASAFPVMVEELDIIKDIGAFLKNITTGSEKDRVSNSGNYKTVKGGHWECPLIFARNGSVQAEVNRTDGDVSPVFARLLEVDYDLLQSERRKVELGCMDAMAGEFYGVAGEIYIQYIVDNWDDVDKLAHRYEKQVARVLVDKRHDRFVCKAAACTLTGAHLGNVLGFHDIDVKLLLKAIVNQHRVHVKEHRVDAYERTDPISILMGIVAEMQPYLIIRNADGKVTMLDRPREIKGRVQEYPDKGITVLSIKSGEVRERLPATSKPASFLAALGAMGVTIDQKDVRYSLGIHFRSMVFFVPNALLSQPDDDDVKDVTQPVAPQVHLH